jgi:TolA-binding protein
MQRRTGAMRAAAGSLVLLVAGLSACSFSRAPKNVEAPTLKSLESRQVAVAPDPGIKADERAAIKAYRDFLAAAPRDPQRPEAMRRLGDLEMDSADNRSVNESGAGAPDYRAAVARYQEYLKAYPNDPGNDRVLYQMARAHEQAGQLDTALKTLDRLVQQYPQTKYRDEAHFRRGELLFAMRDYGKAEQAYATLLRAEPPSAYHERALYMHGWSLFKQSRLEEALHSFFGVLDIKMENRAGGGPLEALPGLTRADRELIEDTFRVTSLSLENLQGAASIEPYMNSRERRAYEFRVYEQLGELYIKQERVKDAADAFGLFAKRYPLHAQAPILRAREIEIYQRAGFNTLALEAKKQYVVNYGARSEFRRANPAGWEQAQPLVKAHLEELARFHHAAAQKSRKPDDYREAVRWYRDYLESFPSDPQAAQNNFLLAELLYETGAFDGAPGGARYAEAAVEYEKTAYKYPPHAKSADAGYAALLAYAQQEKRTAPAQVAAMQKASVDSALRFAAAFPKDARTGPVLTNAAEKLFAQRDERAAAVAQQVLKLDPPASPKERRVAWTVTAHSAFERGEFDRAERSYREVLALTPEKDPARAELTERVAASVYKQGEQARAAGKLRGAVAHFSRVAAVAPLSPVRAHAEYDAAAALIALKDWDAAARTLEDFRRRYPNHPLQGEVSGKLAVAYTEKGQWGLAAGEFERMAGNQKDPKLARDGQWHAAELYEKAGSRAQAAAAYERYVKLYPDPLEASVEARARLARIAKEDGNAARALAWNRQVLQADQSGGRARTDRTRYLGANAALELAAPVYDEYRRVALVEPLKKQLKLKKAKMEEVLKAYTVAAEYGVADVTTAATYQIAELYRDFGKSLLESQRPKGLSKVEREQYDVLLEEQAFPFEEKALEVHELNARRSASGIYDKWVKSSYAALSKLRPVRYGKSERSEVAIDAIR